MVHRADSALESAPPLMRALDYESDLTDASTLRRRAIHGSVWTTSEYIVGTILRLGSNLVLTRLLFPEMFGLMALVNTFLMGLQMFSDVGIGPSIIQNRRGDDPDFLSTAWTIQVMRGVALTLVSCIIAKPVALIYGEPQLQYLIPVAGLSALIAGFNSTSLFRLNRHLHLGRLTVLSIATQLLSLAGMIVWALLSKSVWALLVPGLIAKVFQLFVSHMLEQDRHDRFHWDPSARDALFQFGKWIFLSTLLTFSADQADKLIIGKLVSLRELGIYNLALMFAALPRDFIRKIGSAVVFPAYSRVQEHGEAFTRIFTQIRISLLIVSAFAVSGLIAGGSPLIHILYDRRWADAQWILPILACGAWFSVMECTNGSALLARGRAHWIAAGTAAELLGMVGMIFLGFHLGPKLGVSRFCGAVIGVASADLFRYAISVIGLQHLGLHVLAKDMGLTAAVALTSGGATLAGQWVFLKSANQVAYFFAAAAVVCSVWAPVAWVHFHRRRSELVDAPENVVTT